MTTVLALFSRFGKKFNFHVSFNHRFIDEIRQNGGAATTAAYDSFSQPIPPLPESLQLRAGQLVCQCSLRCLVRTWVRDTIYELIASRWGFRNFRQYTMYTSAQRAQPHPHPRTSVCIALVAAAKPPISAHPNVAQLCACVNLIFSLLSDSF